MSQLSWKKIKDFTASNRKVIFLILYLLIFLAYIYVIRTIFLSALANFTSLLGYNDTQHFWDTVENLLSGKIIYSDFYYEYGYLWLAAQAAFYFIFGRSFFALIVSTYIALPILTLVISYFIAKIVLKKDYLIILFLVLCLFFYPNYATTSLRHIVAELGLALFVLYLFNQKRILAFLSGLVVGLGLLASTEYGAAANLAILIIAVLAFLTKKVKFKDLVLFYLGEAVIVLPFVLMLWRGNALTNWFDFFKSFAGNFYFASPCGDSYPRLCDIGIGQKTSKLIFAGLPIEFLQRLNLYFVPIAYLILLILVLWQIYKKRVISLSNIVKLLLIIYGSMIYLRTLDNPCLGYFYYGLIPFFLLLLLFLDDLVLFIRSSKNKQNGVISLIVILSFWFFITQPAGYNLLFPLPADKNNFNHQTKTLNPKIGYPISSEMASEYNDTIKFLDQNMGSNDSLFIYPWGPYKILGNFHSPSKFENSMLYLVAGEKYNQIEKDDLAKAKPRFVVVNNWNNSGMVTYGRKRTDVMMYFGNPAEDGPVFAGFEDPIQDYILENYQTVFHNRMAIVMERRQKPISVKRDYQPIVNLFDQGNSSKEELDNLIKLNDQNNDYRVTGNAASVKYQLPNSIEGRGVEVNLNLIDPKLAKHLSRYEIEVQTTFENGGLYKERFLAKKIDQTQKIAFPKSEKIQSIEIKIVKNKGFVWFLNPSQLEIKSLKIF